MPTVREYFVAEAREYLDSLRDLLAADGDVPEAAALLRQARALRGSAQMADENAVARVAATVETAGRALLRGEMAWSDAMAALARDTVGLLRELVARPPDDHDDRVETTLDRWRGIGVEPADSALAGATRTRDAGRRVPDAAGPDTFRAYAAREADGILTVLEDALAGLRDRPTDREPLKAILRRQRALLGAAALDSLPALAETLQTLDDVSRLIARRKAAVAGEWLEPYLAARDVLAWLVPRIGRGEAVMDEPEALSRLRGVRDRLFAASAGSDEERRRPEAPEAADVSSEDRDVFRREAGLLLGRMARMAAELASAPESRRAMLRRELRDAFTALSDNARAFDFPDAAALALTGRTWLEAGDPAALDVLLDRLRERIRAGGGGAEPAVPIEDLTYRGEAALRRALELQPVLAAAVAGEPDARAALEEVFDLIRLGLE